MAGARAPRPLLFLSCPFPKRHETRSKNRSKSQEAFTNPAFSGVILKYESPACAGSRNGPPNFFSWAEEQPTHAGDLELQIEECIELLRDSNKDLEIADYLLAIDKADFQAFEQLLFTL